MKAFTGSLLDFARDLACFSYSPTLCGNIVHLQAINETSIAHFQRGFFFISSSLKIKLLIWLLGYLLLYFRSTCLKINIFHRCTILDIDNKQMRVQGHVPYGVNIVRKMIIAKKGKCCASVSW